MQTRTLSGARRVREGGVAGHTIDKFTMTSVDEGFAVARGSAGEALRQMCACWGARITFMGNTKGTDFQQTQQSKQQYVRTFLSSHFTDRCA